VKIFEFPAKNSDHPARMHQLYAVDYRKRFIASETVPLNKTIMFAKFRVAWNSLHHCARMMNFIKNLLLSFAFVAASNHLIECSVASVPGAFD
jgi:hypothetical protein